MPVAPNLLKVDSFLSL